MGFQTFVLPVLIMNVICYEFIYHDLTKILHRILLYCQNFFSSQIPFQSLGSLMLRVTAEPDLVRTCIFFSDSQCCTKCLPPSALACQEISRKPKSMLQTSFKIDWLLGCCATKSVKNQPKFSRIYLSSNLPL